jgi:hypothetical protein
MRSSAVRKVSSDGSGLNECVTTGTEDGANIVLFQPFELSGCRRMLRPMEMEDNVALAGNLDDRVVQLLRMARHYARVAQSGARGRKQDALTDLEDALTDQLASPENADEDDKADAEESGEAERERRAWRPLRAA